MNLIKTIIAAGLAAASFGASAAVDLSTIQTTSGLFSPVANAVNVSFDTAYPAGISYTGGDVVIGNQSGVYAAPPGDATHYLTIGAGVTSTATFSGSGASYFGFYLSSPDTFNSVTFNGSDGSHTTYSGSALVQFVTASALNADGDQSHGFYFGASATAGTAFTSVAFHSDGYAMETDNHAFIAAVPEPETYAMLLAGLGMMGFVARRRKAGKAS